MQSGAVSEVAANAPCSTKRVRVESYPGALPSRGGRRTFWVEAPRRHVVNRLAFSTQSSHVPESSGTDAGDNRPRPRTGSRLKPAMAPHRLTVVVAARASTVDRTAFLQPVAETQWNSACLERGEQPPSIFAVPLYVWQDTTLREILELVLARNEAARKIFLGDQAAAQPSMHGRRTRKAPRHETCDPELANQSECEQSPQAVKVLAVSMGPDRLPLVSTHTPLATLSLVRPPAEGATADRITMNELRASRKSRLRLGDLLVLVPSSK